MGKLTGRSAIVTADVDEDLLIHVVDTAGTPASFKATLSQLYAVFPKNSSAGAGDVNKVPKWTAANELGASIIEDDGSTATIGGTIKITGGSPSAGKFLQCDGAGLGSWADVGGVQVSGTPVDNQIAIWTAADTIEGDSNFVWDTGLDMTATAEYGIDLTHNPSTSGTTVGHNLDLTGNASTVTAYGFYSKVDTALGGNALGGHFRVLDSDGSATGSLNSVSGGSVGGISYGSRNTVLFSGTETSGGSMYGSSNVITVDTTGTHGASMFGSSVDLNYNKVGGTLTNAFGFYSTGIVCNDSGATISNAYGVYLGDNAGSGTITNSYGIYQAGTDDKNYFGAQLQLNHTSGTAGQFLKAVDVDGNAEWADVPSGVTASTGLDNRIAVFDGTDSIEGDANFVWDAGLDITATAQYGIDLTHNPSASGTTIGHNIDLTGNASTTTAYGFYSKVDTSLGGSAYGGWFRVLGSDGAAFGSYGSIEGSVGGAAYGAYNLISIAGTNTSAGSMYGSQNIITVSTSGTHGASMFGSSVDLNYNKVGGTLTNAFGFYSTGIVCDDSGATITNAYGIYLGDNAGAGTITNSYGVYQAGADDENYFAGSIESNSQVYSSIASTVTPSLLAATIDWDNGNMQVLDMSSSINTLTLNNPKAGASYFIKIIQSVGGASIVWPATVKWAENDEFVGSTGVGDIDAVALTYDGTNYLANYSLDYQ